MIVAALATALATHALLTWGQVAGVMQGDYGQHGHAAVAPMLVGTVTIGAAVLLSYLVHLAGGNAGVLPTLARRFAGRLGWRSAGAIALLAAVVLVGMETGEQLTAGRFDGLSSAFGNLPVIGLALLALCGAGANVALRAMCQWLARAHDRILRAVTYLLRCTRDVKPSLAYVLMSSEAAGRYARDTARIFGRRAPPVPR